MLKHKEKLSKKKLYLVFFVGLLFSFSTALTAYLNSSFFQQAWDTDNVSAFYLVASALSLFLLLNLYYWTKRLGKVMMFSLLMLLQFLLLSVLVSLGVSRIASFALVGYIASFALVYATIDIFLESFSSDKFSGRIRGIFLTAMNMGWLLAPLIATYLLGRFGYSGVFMASLFLVMIIFLIVITSLRLENGVVTKEHRSLNKLINVIRKRQFTLRQRDILAIYVVAMLLEVFYNLMTIFMPLLLLAQGFDWNEIGKIFFIMLLPFVLFQYLLGRVADTRFGEKEFLAVSLVTLAISTGVIAFVESKSILIWMVILFGSRTGAAMLEVLRDSYFFKKVDATDVDLIHLYKTAGPIGIILSSAIFACIFLLGGDVSTNFMFVAVLCIIGLIPVALLRDSTPEREMNQRV